MKSWKDVRSKVVTDEARVAAYREQMEAEVAAYRLAEIREARELTQGQVAKELGVNQSNVSRLETGDVARSEVGTLAKYIEALGGTLRLVADFGEETQNVVIVVSDLHSHDRPLPNLKGLLSHAPHGKHLAGR
jgi:transcriptional regulator with XRE-family HTH domain